MTLAEEIAAIRARVQSGQLDLRDVGKLLNEYWSQDLPRAILDAAASTARPTVVHDDVRAWISYHNEEALLADGFEDAIVGVAQRCSKEALVVYDIDKCVQILMERDGMSEEEAQEFLAFNTLGAWMGENTPLFLTRYEPGG